MSQQAALAAQLNAATDQMKAIGTEVKKVGTETVALQGKVSDLTTALASQDNVSPALQAAADALTAQTSVLSDAVKAVDDLVPDAPATDDGDTGTPSTDGSQAPQ